MQLYIVRRQKFVLQNATKMMLSLIVLNVANCYLKLWFGLKMSQEWQTREIYMILNNLIYVNSIFCDIIHGLSFNTRWVILNSYLFFNMLLKKKEDF